MDLIKNNIEKKEKEAKVYNQLLGYGWTPAQAAGIVGNLVHESGLNTTIIGDKKLKENAYGIAQWRDDPGGKGGRFTNLKKRHGNDWDKLENQVEYLNWELNNTEKKAGNLLRKVNTPMAAGQVVSDLYERPQIKYYQNKDRQKSVENVYRNYVDNNYQYVPQEGIQVQDIKIPTFDFSYSPIVTETTTTPNVQIQTEVSNLSEPQQISNLATPSVDTQYELAKQELLKKQQQKINEQNFLQDLLAASQVKYVEPEIEEEIYQDGGVIKDDMGQWKYPGQITEIQGNIMATYGYGDIPLYVVPDVGAPKIVYPNTGQHYFKGASKFTEYPLDLTNKKDAK